jgi:hypothetical protein
MKGVVFVELVRMAESGFGEDTVDAVLDGCPLSTGGAFTSVGNYPCSDLITIVEALGKRGGVDPNELQRQFGHWMLAHFVETYPHFFEGKRSAFEMLEAIDQEVHVEVRKLYPDAELPRFETERLGPDRVRMVYSSPRPLGAFCRGLIEACLEHYAQPGVVVEAGPPAREGAPVVFDVALGA